mmetsp:Transcript_86871/g.246280  ORF Transcript_86871/g.246280 Transcript_86871/m.246280 type:complete len:153 (+) Transcript_86871:62-520(+)|eukprot:CAMPEP_0168414526 /NCGR_PEP_ID=MMETSP0228-20121227/29767_1 /TAXON_ID=133427 /ORGANISM="Protoceratium reticulatum, Strain CCCM 535 (=CCMP 1889)" /LENGTH=152 /DNA_ID=CAMNT_0008428317 /DNA_START=30 /DNA_END=488 /DNA_ORIENTATION=-
MAERAESAPFVAAPAFGGARPGYAFKKGNQGLGYYLDARHGLGREGKQSGSPAAAGAKGFSPASSFEGARPGYVFKLGRLGLGYYADTYDVWMASSRCAAPRMRPTPSGKRAASESALARAGGPGQGRREQGSREAGGHLFARAGGKMLGLG